MHSGSQVSAQTYFSCGAGASAIHKTVSTITKEGEEPGNEAANYFLNMPWRHAVMLT